MHRRHRCLRTLRSLVANDRVRSYQAALREALDLGYRAGGLLDFSRWDGQGRFLVVRHDVDEPAGVRELLAADQRLGIRSSWYFRWSTARPDLIEAVKGAGAEVSLHFETLATVCAERKVASRDGVGPEIVKEARRRTIEEIESFRRRFGVECRTVAAHGAPINTALGIPNQAVIDGAFHAEAGIVAEAYDAAFNSRVEAHACDQNLLVGHGWEESVPLGALLARGHRTIHLLTHPHHWTLDRPRQLRYIARWLRHGELVG